MLILKTACRTGKYRRLLPYHTLLMSLKIVDVAIFILKRHLFTKVKRAKLDSVVPVDSVMNQDIELRFRFYKV